MRMESGRWWTVGDLVPLVRCSPQGARDALGRLVAGGTVGRRKAHPAFEYQIGRPVRALADLPLRITPRRTSVLATLQGSAALSAAEVAAQSGVPGRTARYWLRRFDEMGWVERTPGLAPMFRLTRKGRLAHRVFTTRGHSSPRPAMYQSSMDLALGLSPGIQLELPTESGN